jgi:hypothetical protein
MNTTRFRYCSLALWLALGCGDAATQDPSDPAAGDGDHSADDGNDEGDEGDGDRADTGDDDGNNGDGDGDAPGDGDGDAPGDGDSDTPGDGDGDGDGDTPGDGDGDTPGDGDGDTPGDGDGDTPSGEIKLPPANGSLDYQLGGSYDPPQGVNVVSRDRTAKIAPGIYNICYVNGFQVQPGEDDLWDADLILRDDKGNPVIDEDWGEAIVDTSTAEKRERIAAFVGEWIDGCAKAGFDAVEIDNLDTFSRSGGRLTKEGAVAMMALFAERAHKNGLAAAQKNSTDLLNKRADMHTDFAVAEECSRYDECGDYVSTYGDAVLMIEYRKQDFDKGCGEYGSSHAIVLRDLNLVPKGESKYVFDDC